MDGEKQKNVTPGEDIEYLHINEETSINPSYQSRIHICDLWKVCLLTLYGGSKSQRKWYMETHQSMQSNLMSEKHEGKTISFLTDIDEEKYMNEEDFAEYSQKCLTSLDDDGSLQGKYHVLSKDLIKLSVSQGIYDARFRKTLKKFSKSLEVDWEEVDNFEQSLVEELVKIQSDEEERERKRKTEQQKKNLKRAFVIGLTAVGGGAILALSAGLAAPLIGAGAVAVLGSGSAAIFTGVSGLAVITSIFGAAGAGLAGYKMTKRIGKIEQFEFGALSNGKHLHVALAVSGFCGADDDAGFFTPWEALEISTEQYFLKWEGKYLRKLGSSIIDFVKREAMQAAVKGILKYTALRAVLKSIAWPLTLISAANLIDNPWNVCTQRSKETGIHLAHVLMSRHQGYRPITLLGFSLGARVIFYCLQTMLNEKDYQGIIEDVVLIGAPVGVSREEWEAFESVISGTLYNCYSRSDWLLKFVYRAASVQVGDIAGLGPIDVSWPRLVNIDLTEMVNSHSDYAEPEVISNILELIGYKTKPIEANASIASVKMPHEYVKEISKTPTKILPQSFSLHGKENKGQQPQDELTTEELETLDRLTSCQGKNVIDNLKNRGSFWKNDDSDGNDSGSTSPVNQSRWQRVLNVTKRGSISRERKMLEAGCDVEVEAPSDYSEGTDAGILFHVGECREPEKNDVTGEADSCCCNNKIKITSEDHRACSKTENLTGCEVRDPNAKHSHHCKFSDMQKFENLQLVLGDCSTHAKVTSTVGDSTSIAVDDTSIAVDGTSIAVDGTSIAVDGTSIVEGSNKTGCSKSKAISTSGKFDFLCNPSRTGRSKSSGDIITDSISDVDSNIEQETLGNEKEFMKIPGKSLLGRVCRNVKFALPSPTLSRHKNEEHNVRKSEVEKRNDNENSSQSSMPKKEFRKMSFPGSF